MLKYTIKRVLLAVITVFIISAITFFAMNAIPGGPFAKEKAPTRRCRLRWRPASTWTSRCTSSSLSI